MNNDIWVYENGVFIGTLNTSLTASTSYASYSVDNAKTNQLKIDLILKHSNGQSVTIVVQLSSGILSITPLTLPSSFKKKVVAFTFIFLSIFYFYQ